MNEDSPYYSLKEEGYVKLLVVGNNMSPILKMGRDYVYITEVKEKILKKGDILLIKRDTGEYILKRIYRVIQNKGFILNGDAEGWTEVIRRDQIINYIVKIEHRGLQINCNNIVYKAIVFIWMFFRPYRYKMHCFKRRLKVNYLYEK